MSGIERSQGDAHLIGPRLSDMGEGATPEQTQAKRQQLRDNATFRASKEATKASLRAVAGRKVSRALQGSATPEESRLVAENALQLAKDAQREVAVSSPFVAHHTTRFGVNAALAGFYTQKAAEVGFDSERGIALLEAAHRCEGQSTRAMVAAAAAVKEFAGKRGSKTIDLGELIAEASKPREAP